MSTILPEIRVKIEILAYFHCLKLKFNSKRGSIRLSLSVHLIYGSAPPDPSFTMFTKTGSKLSAHWFIFTLGTVSVKIMLNSLSYRAGRLQDTADF